MALSSQLTPSKTGSEPSLGSATRNLFSALFGFGGLSIREALTIWISPTPTDPCAASSTGFVETISAPLT